MMKELQEVGRSFFWCVLLVGGVIGANAQRVKLSPEELVKAEALAKVHCATCHAWPEPGLLDKETWRLHVLPTMTLLGGHTNLVGSAGSSTSAYNFALLENDGSLGFRVLTKEGTLDGRWMTMDVADLEGDGDADIVLGSVLNVPGKVPPEMWRRWQLKPVSAMVLRNLASDRKRKN